MVTSNTEVKDKINQYLPIWNINSIAERFIELFPRYQNEYEESIKQILADRKSFTEQLKNIDALKVIDGKANFLFCKIKNKDINSTKLRRKLFSKYNLLIKDCSNKTLLKDRHIRISVRKPAENKKLVNALKEVIE